MFTGKRNSLRKVLYRNQNTVSSNATTHSPASNFVSTVLTSPTICDNSATRCTINSLPPKGRKGSEFCNITNMPPDVLPVCSCNNASEIISQINQSKSLITSTSPRLQVDFTKANTICIATESDRNVSLNRDLVQNLPLTVDVNCTSCNNDTSVLSPPSSGRLSVRHIGSNFFHKLFSPFICIPTFRSSIGWYCGQ